MHDLRGPFKHHFGLPQELSRLTNLQVSVCVCECVRRGGEPFVARRVHLPPPVLPSCTAAAATDCRRIVCCSLSSYQACQHRAASMPPSLPPCPLCCAAMQELWLDLGFRLSARKPGLHAGSLAALRPLTGLRRCVCGWVDAWMLDRCAGV